MVPDDDLFLELLSKLSTSRLRERREQIHARIARLQFEGEYVDRALAAKGTESASPPSTSSRRPDARPAVVKTKRRGNKRDAILAVMRTDPDRVWLPSEVRERLAADQGIDMTRESVRVAMKRMLADRELQRPGEGLDGFKLVARNDVGAVSAEPDHSKNGGDAPLFSATQPNGNGAHAQREDQEARAS